jgi:adenylyl cyclase-associated protein
VLSVSNQLVELGKKISPDVGAISEAYHKAALAIRDLIAKAATTKKPAAGDLPSHLGAAAAAMGEVAKVKDANNRTTKFPNHLSAVAEGTPGMGWVSVEKTPGPFAKENSEPALFYTNRILKDFKGKDETHENWVKAFVGFINAVPAYVKEHHTTGLKWN